MWYFELWHNDDFLCKSELFHTKEEAEKGAKTAIKAFSELSKNRKNYTYELYCTCEDEEEV